MDHSLTERGSELVGDLLPLFCCVVAYADEIVGERLTTATPSSAHPRGQSWSPRGRSVPLVGRETMCSD